jgi:hypothetical protein
MNNQHAGLNQVLADQRITQLQQQAAQARLGRSADPPRRRRRSRATRGGWQLARRRAGHRRHTASQPPTQRQSID